jgi:hypothetical protein
MLKTVTNSINASQIQTPITLPGDVTLSTGNLIIGTAGNGIDFSADPSAAGMTSELLDDYEEGTFTPTIIGTTTAGVGTYSLQTGEYTKIGNRVCVNISLRWSAHTGTGNMRMDGLPFTIGGTTSNFFIPSVFIYALTLSANNVIQCFALGSTSQIVITEIPTGGGTGTDVAMDTSAEFYATLVYRV